jgi:hypothetical protein
MNISGWKAKRIGADEWILSQDLLIAPYKVVIADDLIKIVFIYSFIASDFSSFLSPNRELNIENALHYAARENRKLQRKN